MSYDPFSERWRRSKQRGEPTVYHYDVLPPEFRVKVAMILDRTLGGERRPTGRPWSLPANETTPNELWKVMHGRIAFSRGVFALGPEAESYRDSVVRYLQEAETMQVLDAIETTFEAIDAEWFRETHPHIMQHFETYSDPDYAIELLNSVFRRHDLGYFFVGGLIVRVDNTFLHAEVIEPALALLHDAEFAGASDEFLSAHRHYRRGEFKDAITDANNAFESTLKTICRKRGIAITGREKTEELVDTVTKALVPPYMQTYFTGLRSAMKGLPTLRNNTAGAAHGQGETPQDVVDHAAAFALHLTAANMVFLVQAWQDMERREPRS